MAKLQLKNTVKLDITEKGKTVETFSVDYKELSKREQRSMGKDNKEILEIFRQGQSMDRRIEATEAKVEALKELDKAKDLLATANTLDNLYEKRDALEDQFNEMGGFDKMVEASKITFDQTVTGDDKERLEKWIEDNSDYGTILSVIAEDAKSQRGKQ